MDNRQTFVYYSGMSIISKAAATLGSKGGKSGTGAAKTRTKEQYQSAVAKRWGHWIDRFWSRVGKGGQDECWPWRPAVKHLSSRYGTIYVYGKNMRPHRLSYAMAFGKIDDDIDVCHSCDNPRCVNPRHLFLGTHQQNMADAGKKGRLKSPKGELHHLSKLTAENVRYIRQAVKAGVQQSELARCFGISTSSLGSVVHGKTWRHVVSP